MKDKYKKCSSFNIMERIVYLCFMKLTFDDCRHYFMKKIDSGTSSYFKIFNYNYKIYSNFELTAVGRAIALFNCKAKMKGFEDAEFTI